MKKALAILLVMVVLALFSGCSSKVQQVDTSILKEYQKTNRLEKYYELQERYDNSRLVLYLNKSSDRIWLINFVAWLSSLILDPPELLAGGGTVAIVFLIFKVLVWWGVIIAGGGGILALLAALGAIFGKILGVPPAIAGLIFLGTMIAILFSVLHSILLGVFGG